MSKPKHLVIELDELGSVPKVFYKGEEITMKEFINFQWQTRTAAEYGSTDVIVDYYTKPSGNVLIERKPIREGVVS